MAAVLVAGMLATLLAGPAFADETAPPMRQGHEPEGPAAIKDGPGKGLMAFAEGEGDYEEARTYSTCVAAEQARPSMTETAHTAAPLPHGAVTPAHDGRLAAFGTVTEAV
jgi:hypothetical protein